ncbi:hypothetical protein [Paenibacillus sp. IITD108]|uniref:hypothetical protein n=1 Tax=Paenibacillus sp. IITD108 TaxID=3116649 RepID=UPI002F40A96F
MGKSINTIIDDVSLTEKEKVEQVTKVILSMDVCDQVSINGSLNENAISFFYCNINSIPMHDAAKEHIVMQYFWNCIDKTGVTDDLISMLVEYYKIFNYLALESIAINLMKNNRVTREQVKLFQTVFSGKVFHKELIVYEKSKLMTDGWILNKEDVELLMNVEAYALLEAALDKYIIEKDALSLFKPIASGEKNKKIIDRLYNKARLMLL